MIGYYLSSNSEMCYSDKTQTFRELNSEHSQLKTTEFWTLPHVWHCLLAIAPFWIVPMPCVPVGSSCHVSSVHHLPAWHKYVAHLSKFFLVRAKWTRNSID